MLDKDIDFPVYRKLSNNKVFFKIINNSAFHEIQIVGKKAQLNKIVATKYPEILRIQDMISYSFEGIIESNDREYSKLLNTYTFI